jgi:hypothetical protein
MFFRALTIINVMKQLYFLALFLTVSAFAKPCGLQGSIEERIKDCSLTKGNFVLVMNSEKGQEFYKDSKSGLIWGSRISTDFNHYGSQKACHDEVSGYENLGLKWRLPTIREFEEASVHGMKAALSSMEHSYWSSTAVKSRKARRRRAQPAQVFLWDGYAEKTDSGDLKDAASVRCVSRD